MTWLAAFFWVVSVFCAMGALYGNIGLLILSGFLDKRTPWYYYLPPVFCIALLYQLFHHHPF